MHRSEKGDKDKNRIKDNFVESLISFSHSVREIADR
jgi:hypothetical protein